MDMTQFSLIVMNSVKEYVQPAIDSLAKRIDDARAALRGEFADAIAAAIAALPEPKPGKNGKDADPGVIEELVARAVAAFPKASDGKDSNAEDVAAIVLPAINQAALDAVAAIPHPKDGEDGKGVTVEDFRQMFEAEHSKWALEAERRAQELFQRAIDRIPVPKDGKDGLGFDDLSFDYDGERTVTLKFQRGEEFKTLALNLPIVIDRGVFKEGAEYARNDGVTYGGSWWLAQKDAPVGKPGMSPDFRLAVKKGRDGKDGEHGKDFVPRTVKIS